MALLGLVILGPVAAADHVLEIERRVELRVDGEVDRSSTDRGRIYLGDQRARFDQGDLQSWILQLDRQRLLFLHHGEQTYLELQLPARLEDYLSAEERSKLERAESELVPQWSVEPTSEMREFAAWKARKVLITGALEREDTEYRHELWLSDELSIPLPLYQALIRSQGAVYFHFRDFATELASLPGFPVYRQTRVTNDQGREHFETRRLVAVEERPAADRLYALPEGYTRVEFAQSQWARVPD
ncbi:MAG: hypothetical protein SX243_17955 [Acidobacteriota bacterium]|nr:hypothetical protein [Acidobacteriota bacterium]